MLIEWIELHELLGVSEIILYNTATSPEVSNVLESYANDAGYGGVRLTVIQWQFPHVSTSESLNRHEAINDCVYRAALRHRYVIVCDPDEVVVPRKPGGWPRFIADVSSEYDIGAYLFQQADFRRSPTNSTSPGDRRDSSPYLVTMQYLWRSDVIVQAGDIISNCKVPGYRPYT